MAEEEVPFLKSLLSDDKSKWFVSDYLAYMEHFPITLLPSLVQVAIEEPDPSYNGHFIQPCLRVFDCLAVLGQIEIIYKAHKELVIGVLSVLYHVRSRFVSRSKSGSEHPDSWQWETVGVKWYWDDKKGYHNWPVNKGDELMSTEEMAGYQPIHDEYMARKRSLIEQIAMDHTSLKPRPVAC